MLILSWILGILLLGWLYQKLYFSDPLPTITESALGTQIKIPRDRSGHFKIPGQIEGIPVTFLIDTGATYIAIPGSLATEAKLPKQQAVTLQTAGAKEKGYFTRIRKCDIGTIVFSNLRAVVVPGMSSETLLLGMNVLKKFKIEQTEEVMILTLRKRE